MDWVREVLYDLRNKGLYRRRVRVEGFKDFCSNDYLGLRKHPRVLDAVKRVLEDYGLGSGASQLVSGYTEYHYLLEEELASFKDTPACVLFGSGYLANVGTIPLLAGERDLIVSDELNHASLIDGCRLSKAEKFIFRHRDYGQVEKFLREKRHRFRRVVLITDTVFSMDGDRADLRALYEIAERYDCILYLDEAHATGTLGGGRGGLREFGLEWEEWVVVMGTLSKAIGSYGAFVCGSKNLIELLINGARTLIFTTSIPPAVCAGALESLRIIKENPGMVEKLLELSRFAHRELKKLPFEVRFGETPILPIMVGDEGKALRLSENLLKRGVLLQAIRYPTVPRGAARLRLTVNLSHTKGDIRELAEILTEEAFKINFT